MNGVDHVVEIGLFSQQHNSLPVSASHGPGLQTCVLILKYGWTKFLVGQVIIMPIIQNTSCKYEPGHRDCFSLKLLWGWCPYQRNRIGLATQLPIFSLGRHSSGHGCSFAYVLDSLAWLCALRVWNCSLLPCLASPDAAECFPEDHLPNQQMFTEDENKYNCQRLLLWRCSSPPVPEHPLQPFAKMLSVIWKSEYMREELFYNFAPIRTKLFYLFWSVKNCLIVYL